ncbi:MAG: RibD family protein, partial [Candidatus Electrothrix sp. AR3]|nr:RibD family protein [Candidatus Electrothrix sp. AR3]
MSLDGKISPQLGQGGAITGASAKQRVHQLRNQLDALLIGRGTALIDNPSLTTRLEQGGRDPLRVILDSRLELPADAKMLQQESTAATWIFCAQEASVERQEQLEQAGAVIQRVNTDANGRPELHQVLRCLGNADITSVLVEGGAAVHGAFLRERLVNQVYLFIAPYFIGDGGTPLIAECRLQKNAISLIETTTESLGQDTLLQGIVPETQNL